ncbi:MAG TPA: leucyl/phenylalanyl-tRNA--protein transferase [Stellaceae bacterium]|nr:leucyl/phenylalanyl-tRNA--protein transferase [Stellaceae bacterium]
MSPLSPAILLRAYAAGLFPMAESAEDPELFWVDPERRGVLPLETFHLPRRLGRTLRNGGFVSECNRDFPTVIEACAAATQGRPKTWINAEIVRIYTALHRQGFAHSVELRHEGEMVGGLYGVSLGAAFFGESMFNRVTDASKLALAHLVARLRIGGFMLLDTQFLTSHLAQFGAVEISRPAYRRRLAAAIQGRAYFPVEPLDGDAVSAVLQSSTPTS